MTETIVTRAPTRIDFGGGWTDVPPYSDEMGGYVCNVAISRYVTVAIGGPDDATIDGDAHADAHVSEHAGDLAIANAAARRLGLSDARIRVTSDFPIGAGLGGSSAAGVAAVSAMSIARGEPLSRSALAEASREIEVKDLGIAGGRQDHYAAAYGGALGLSFRATGVDVERIPLTARFRAELESRCLIIYTGQSRMSGDTIDAVLGAYRAHEPKVLHALHRMKELARSMTDALQREDLDDLGWLVGEQWTHQRSLHPAIPTPRIDEIIACGQHAGAIGAKALGASGGGCVLLVAKRDTRDAVCRAVEHLGELLSFTIDEGGATQCR